MGMRGTRSHNGLCWNKLNAQQWAVDRAVHYSKTASPKTEKREESGKRKKKKGVIEDLRHLYATHNVIVRSMDGISSSGSRNYGGQVAAYSPQKTANQLSRPINEPVRAIQSSVTS